MSIPYNDNLSLSVYRSDPLWHHCQKIPSLQNKDQVKRATNELLCSAFKQPMVRSIQYARDTLRLVLKVPLRAISTPIFLEKNWQERERCKVNAKLTGYAFVQLISIPAKFTVALVALGISVFSEKKAKWLLDSSEGLTKHLDGRASQLEALKEEGAKKIESRDEFNKYRNWLYSINPKLCLRL